MDLKSMIRDIPDFPKKGILFRDITTLLKDADAYKQLIDDMAAALPDMAWMWSLGRKPGALL